ncbi:MAG TPA: S9 family peptidase [Bryobacteraceae bacterium]|jgi:oligopeptidase B
MSLTLTTPAPEETVRPPVAKIMPVITTLHGDTRVDNYAWLRDRKDPDTIAYLEAENAYTKVRMQHTAELELNLYSEMLGRIQQTDFSVPVKRDSYFYYTRTEEGKQYSTYCRKAGSLDAAEEVLLDGNAMAEGQAYFQIGIFSPSPDHKLLAYAVDLTGDEIFTVRVKDLATGNLLADEIPGTSTSLEWAEDNATFFYNVLDEARRPHKIFRHVLGESKDVEIYHETDQRFELDVSKTSSHAYLLISSNSPLTTEIQCLRADDPGGEFRAVLPRVPEIEYDLTHHGDSFFIRTNDGGKTFRVVEAPVGDPSKPNWKEILPVRANVTVEGVVAFANHLVFEERELGLSQLRIQNFAGETHYVEFPEPVYSAALTGNAEFATSILRFNYTSLITPNSVFDYNMETRARELKKQQPVLGGYDPSRYTSSRIYVTASDGKQVPVSLVYKKDLKLDGQAPMLLYGYGSYGISIEPSFRSDRLSLIDRGIIYAIAHIRGGGDLGKPWHEDGRLLHKMNTFTDFIACAEALIAARYTSASRLAMEGRSAGGLLVGAVTNMRPELFAVVLAGVPFVDALNTMLDATLPLTVGEYEEWGNPEDKQYYDYIKAYAPYENVAPGDHPTMLITAGLNDPRVSYWEPAKWAAKLRATNTGDRMLLLKTNMGSGHFGASGRYEYLKETAFNYAFLLNALRIENQP